MTYKTVARQVHFRAQEGSSSIRVSQRGYGGTSMQGDPIAILPTLREQFATIGLRMQELQKLIPAASTHEQAEHLRKELAAKNSQWFNLRKIIYQGCVLAKERIFMNVAKQRLPEDLYAMLVAEAHDLWSSEGYPELMPEPNKQERRRASRKVAYQDWKRGKA